jgi:hypothetical protein
MIPKIIHFVWIGSELPTWAVGNIHQFTRLNPNYEIRIHGEEVLLPELADAYELAMDLSSKADLLRYSALSLYGGWYFDVDFWPLRPLDDAVRAWELTGDKLFLSRQQGHLCDKLPFANGMLACKTESHGLADIIDLAKATKPDSRISYGPKLIAQAITGAPLKFTISHPGWWFPLSTKTAAAAYSYLRDGYHGTIANTLATAGQLPFAAHLWAHGRSAPLADAWQAECDLRPVAVVNTAARKDHPLHSLAAGFEAAGYRVLRPQKLNELMNMFMPPAVMAGWNGMRDPSWVNYATAQGVPFIRIEHGFYDRRQYTQADHEGFLHWASWRRNLTEPAPDRSRLTQTVMPLRHNRDGYILVLGQMANDTQMADSEIKGPVPLQRNVIGALPEGAKAFFRPHPQCAHERPNKMHRTLPILGDRSSQREIYAKTQHGVGLDEALDGASFVITINSNAINEALLRGVPVLAFGPALGIYAGVVKQTSVVTLAADIQTMLDGWMPDQDAVENYLAWLACRQWSNDELSSPAVARMLLDEAGVLA